MKKPDDANENFGAALKTIHKDPVVAALLTIHSQLEGLREISLHQADAIQAIRDAIIGSRKGRG